MSACVAGLCASHTPLKDHHDPGAAARNAVDACFAGVRAWLRQLDPELVIVLGPDHFNGFFYRLMPSFCVGAALESIGDWSTPAGPVAVDAKAAEACVAHLHRRGVDAAISYRMEADHGLTQTLQMALDWAALPPVVPLFVNCAAPPRPPFERVIVLGRALGEFALGLDRRVLIVGTGGLSHDPPVPALATAPPEIRERMIAGGPLSPAARAARETRVLQEAVAQAEGRSTAVPVSPDWDRAFIEALQARDFDRFAALEDDALTAAAGRGGHEVRTWVATAAAMSVVPRVTPRLRLYRPIPQWIAGFAVMSYE